MAEAKQAAAKKVAPKKAAPKKATKKELPPLGSSARKAMYLRGEVEDY